MAQRAHFDSPWKQVLNRFLPDFLLFCLPKLAEEGAFGGAKKKTA